MIRCRKLMVKQTQNTNKMKKFNVNEFMYIQITESGWKHLRKTVGEEYIKNCIEADGYKKEINGEIWYRLQCWSVFDLLPSNFGGQPLFKTNVMFDDELLESVDINIKK